jgi:hypothetical protein
MLERVLGVNHKEAGSPENPHGEAAVVAMLGPEPDLDWINGSNAVELTVNSRGFVRMDGIETDSKSR